MLGHVTSLNKFKRIKTTSSIFSKQQLYETRNQLHNKNWKIHKYVKIKQHAVEQPMSQRKKSKEKSKYTLRHMKIEM